MRQFPFYINEQVIITNKNSSHYNKVFTILNAPYTSVIFRLLNNEAYMLINEKGYQIIKTPEEFKLLKEAIKQ